MPNITLQIPTEIEEILSKHPEIKWERIVMDSLWNYAKKIRLIDKLTLPAHVGTHGQAPGTFKIQALLDALRAIFHSPTAKAVELSPSG